MRSSDLLLIGNELELLSATLFVTGQDMQIIDVWDGALPRPMSGRTAPISGPARPARNQA
jgi:hypothetical protein